MSQTIDLRKKQLPEQPQQAIEPLNSAPMPPAPEEKRTAPSSEPKSPKDASSVSWDTMLNRVPSKQTAWYAAILLFVASGAIAYSSQDILFSTALGLAGVVIILRAYSKPNISHVHLNRISISVDEQKYLYHEVSSFWLDYQPPHTKELSLQFKKIRNTPLRIPLEDTNPLEIRSLMIQFIPEKEHERSVFDYVVHLLGF